MRRLVSFFAIALFLFIPLVGSATMVGTADIAINWNTTLSGVPYYVLYYGVISNVTGTINSPTGTTLDLFCISAQPAQSGNFGFNTITPGGLYYDEKGIQVNISSTVMSQAAWVADNWRTYGTGSTYDRAMAQLAIWKILGIGDYTSSYPEAGNMYSDATNGSHNTYATTNWYAAFDSQDYLVPVPEPGILILLGIALSALGLVSRRFKF